MEPEVQKQWEQAVTGLRVRFHNGWITAVLMVCGALFGVGIGLSAQGPTTGGAGLAVFAVVITLVSKGVDILGLVWIGRMPGDHSTMVTVGVVGCVLATVGSVVGVLAIVSVVGFVLENVACATLVLRIARAIESRSLPQTVWLWLGFLMIGFAVMFVGAFLTVSSGSMGAEEGRPVGTEISMFGLLLALIGFVIYLAALREAIRRIRAHVEAANRIAVPEPGV